MASDGILLGGDGTAITAAPTKALALGKKPIATDVSALSEKANITLYADYICPACGQFEATNAEQISAWVKAGEATLEVHPISILDQASAGSKYSTRSANTAACVANFAPDDFLAVNTALFAQQPAENTTGLTNAKLASLVNDAGVTSKKVADCITDGTFNDWVTASTKRATDGPIPNASIKNVRSTPTAIVNGVQYEGSITDADEFATFVGKQAAETK
jgi:protein-disulfide isomerase